MPLTVLDFGYKINITCVERIDDDPLKMLKTEDCTHDAVYHTPPGGEKSWFIYGDQKPEKRQKAPK